MISFCQATRINHMRVGILITLLVLVVTLRLQAGDSEYQLTIVANHPFQQIERTIQTFQNSFDHYVHDDSIVGAGYQVLKDGQATVWHPTGMADRDLKQPVDQNTIFHWGSIT